MLNYGQLRELRRQPDRRPRAARRIALEARAERLERRRARRAR